MGELGHIFLQGEMEMKGVARGGRVRESSAEQQEWTRSKAGRSTENPVIGFILIIATLMSSYSKVIQSASSYLSLCVCLLHPNLSSSPVRPSGDFPADAGAVAAHLCQILPSALPSQRPDWNHPHWPGGLLGETAADTILWSTLCYGDFTHGSLAAHDCSKV